MRHWILPGGERTCGRARRTAAGLVSALALPFSLFALVAPIRADAAGYASAVSADQPVSYWRLGDTSGGVAADTTGLNPGQLQGGVTPGQPGPVPGGGAMRFDGTGDVYFGDPASLHTQRWSVELWFDTTSTAGSTVMMRSRHYGYVVGISGGQVSAAGNAADLAGFGVASAASYADGAWHHLVATKSDTAVTLYVDGATVGSAAADPGMHYESGGVALARDGDFPGAYFTGLLSEAAFYDHALTAQQVSAHYTAARGQPPAITSAASATFNAMTPGSFTVTTSGMPAPAISVAGALPQGVTLHDNGDGTAALQGTPARGTAGSYALTVVARNGSGADATQPFTLTVAEAATGTAIVAGNAAPSFGDADTFTATVAAVAPAGGTPAGVVAFSVDGAAAGSSTLVAGQAAWTASGLEPGVHTITATYGGEPATYTGSRASTVVTVGCATTYTGNVAGGLRINGGAVCIENAHVRGGISGGGHASLFVSGSTVDGGVDVDGANAVDLCGSDVRGAVTVSGSSGVVLLGGGSTPWTACAPDSFHGRVALSPSS